LRLHCAFVELARPSFAEGHKTVIGAQVERLEDGFTVDDHEAALCQGLAERGLPHLLIRKLSFRPLVTAAFANACVPRRRDRFRIRTFAARRATGHLRPMRRRSIHFRKLREPPTQLPRADAELLSGIWQAPVGGLHRKPKPALEFLWVGDA
jgi:hypothetical protein